MKALKQVLNFNHFSQLHLELGICSNALLDWTAIPQTLADLHVRCLYQQTFFFWLLSLGIKNKKFYYFIPQINAI